MGCTSGVKQETRKQIINVATLTYSGTNISPFEFYSIDKDYKENSEEKKLNKIFRKKSKLTDDVRRKLQKIDEKIKRERYSPLYRRHCGIKNGVFETREEFEKTWLQVFNKALKNNEELRKEYGIAKEEEMHPDIRELRKFDFNCYEAILHYLYDHIDEEKLKKKISVINYCQFIESFFSKTHLSEANKITSVVSFALQLNLDVFFIQNSTERLRLQFEKKTNFRILMGEQPASGSKKGRSMLVVNEKSFQKAQDGNKGNLKFLQIFKDKHFNDKKKENFLQLNSSVILSIGNYIFLGVNFTQTTQQEQAKFKEKKKNSPNRKEILNFINDLKVLKKYFPKKYIVVGGSMGTQIKGKIENFQTEQEEEFLENHFDIYPGGNYKKKEDVPSNSSKKIFHCEKCYMMEINQTKKSDNKGNLMNYFTTMKKPTSMQLSFIDQAKNEIIQCCDQIIYDRRIRMKKFSNYQQMKKNNISGRYTIGKKIFSCKKSEKFYMPNQIHPFSHLIVIKSLKVPRRIPKDYNVKLIDKKYQKELISSSSSDRSSKCQDEKHYEGYKKEEPVVVEKEVIGTVLQILLWD